MYLYLKIDDSSFTEVALPNEKPSFYVASFCADFLCETYTEPRLLQRPPPILLIPTNIAVNFQRKHGIISLVFSSC